MQNNLKNVFSAVQNVHFNRPKRTFFILMAIFAPYASNRNFTGAGFYVSFLGSNPDE